MTDNLQTDKLLLDADRWFPIGRADDAPFRHVLQTKLLGRELAVWRADDGFVNVWDNRCLHRGVRLTVGMNEGVELRCLYHGWRYASRDGGCTYIPAHPADAPAQTIRNRTFPAVERHGLIWTTLGDAAPAEPLPELALDDPFALRSLPFSASPALVNRHLDNADPTALFFVQPVDAHECVVHSVLAATPPAHEQISVWRHHADELTRVRDAVEAIAAGLPAPEPLVVALERIEPQEQGVPMPRARSDAELRVRVARKWSTATGVVALELDSIGDPLPAPQPGSHIDVHLPNGLVRQYSLTNRSGDAASYVIGVKLEPNSRGGSSCIHDVLREGDVVAISAPRNNFTLRRDAADTILIAGGIGLTPLLAMAETLQAGGLSYSLHAFAQSSEHLAFADRIENLGEAATTHLGRSPAETGEALDSILATPDDDAHIYICGPGPMLDAARSRAEGHGWPDSSVHFEYFRNDTEVDNSSAFTLNLARSGLTLSVGPGETILEVLRSAGVAMPSSCEQGACGTCVVGVVSGVPVHQDVYLNPTERAAGDRIATCVSRSADDNLVLDL